MHGKITIEFTPEAGVAHVVLDDISYSRDGAEHTGVMAVSETKAKSCACLKRGSKGRNNPLTRNFFGGDSAKKLCKCLGCHLSLITFHETDTAAFLYEEHLFVILNTQKH